MKRRRLALRALALLLSVVGATVVASPAQAFEPRPPAILYHGHVFSGAAAGCLDPGIPANTQVWFCSSANTQVWTYSSRFRMIINYALNKCLDDGAGINGSGAFLNTCDMNSQHQRWFYDNTTFLINVASGRCLDWDMTGFSIKVEVWDCNSGANQQWFFEFED